MKMIVSFVPYVPYVPVNRNRWRFRLALLKNGLETQVETLKREVEALIQAGEELGVKERLIVTWDDEAELDNGISVVPAWRFLLGL